MKGGCLQVSGLVNMNRVTRMSAGVCCGCMGESVYVFIYVWNIVLELLFF